MKVFNSLTKKKQELVPLNKGEVGLYSCGPTVYSFAHIGNLRAYVFADLLKRTLTAEGLKVKHIMNITDVGHLTSDADEGEDKLEKAAKKEKKTAWDIAKFYEKAFMKDIKALNIIYPNSFCRATEYIKEQIELIKKLEEKSFTYKISDGIYFDTSKFPDYGKMSTMDLNNLEEGKRIGVVSGKKNKTDFALWKFSPNNEKRDMEWESPWGVGFPGWHIECSAMSTKHLGQPFDIHTGGVDHLNIHHPNEIAQSECAYDKKFVNYWMHNEFLIVKEGKMSKSKGNVLTLSVLEEKGYIPMHFRYLLLQTHYRKQLLFSFEALDGAKQSYDRLKELISKLGSKKGTIVKKYYDKFLKAMSDDLNSSVALSELWALIRDEKVSNNDKLSTILKMDEVLGLELTKFVKEFVPKEVLELLKLRNDARESKDWNKSDELRDKIKKLGYEVKDGKEISEVKKIK